MFKVKDEVKKRVENKALTDPNGLFLNWTVYIGAFMNLNKYKAELKKLTSAQDVSDDEAARAYYDFVKCRDTVKDPYWDGVATKQLCDRRKQNDYYLPRENINALLDAILESENI